MTSLSLSFSFITTIIPLTLVSSNCFDCSPILRARNVSIFHYTVSELGTCAGGRNEPMQLILKSTSNNLWDCVTSKEDLTSQKYDEKYVSVQFSSVAQSCPTLCDPMNCSTPGLPVHHQLPAFTQSHVHRVGDAIQ